MSDLQVVQGDDKPDVIGTLYDSLTNAPMDLTDVASVRFQMREANDRRYTINAAALVTDAANGKVRYSWAADDLSRPGNFQAQWELHFTDTTIQTTDPPNTITIRRQ